ncbi:Formylglycine-generating sulfatase enzyme [Stieleria bergensis]|uniref:Formylglycine-generating sulfatase enzyme n=1 Tax=Stieleria bergensis TaxID=2528025 RepID=A0A517T1K3_9BACT|nr:Formylglycine-generating sulfatase enzyme [Planctomycetes bacterium SV_7m_r]
MKVTQIFSLALTLIYLVGFSQSTLAETPLTIVGEKQKAAFEAQRATLQKALTAALPNDQPSNAQLINKTISSDALDAQLLQYVVLTEATPAGLAEFTQQSQQNAALVKRLLSSPELLRQMLIADGANAPKQGRSQGPAQYGNAAKIYSDIIKGNKQASSGVLQRLALAISLEHGVPIAQSNPAASPNAPATVDPVSRYRHFETAYLAGELDPQFQNLSTWELRFVIDGDEPDETLAWGRKMLRNYRPDHVYNANDGWRYVSIVTSDVKYGSGDVKYDRPELQKYQNILMNGGVCGRRAFFGRFILRSFGIPTTARPSRGHAALAHWTPDGWVVNLGGAWGCGWTATRYDKDVYFLASTQARANSKEFVKVKRAQWIGDAFGETRTYGSSKDKHGFWNNVALKTQQSIITQSKAVTLDALGEDLGEANEPTVAEKVLASPTTDQDKEIQYGSNETVLIPAAAYTKPAGNTREVMAMKSFGGGLQIFLPRFFPQGQTVLRGGTWKGDPNACTSGHRLLSGGYGRYENWGLRAAASAATGDQPSTKTLDLGNGVTMEMVYIKPGTFVMGGESKTDGRFECVEIPQHEVTLTKGFYLGKFEVTQAQYQAIMGSNPSRSTKADDCPVDNVSEADAISFCGKVAEQTGVDVRLPTEAEWEYASRAGRTSKWFFGDDPAAIADYAWYKNNAGGKSHPVGQKKPNPWGLHDIYGNVCERISDKYARNYYSISPKIDPTGPSQGNKSHFEYEISVTKPGNYLLSALVVTSNDHQRLNVAINDTQEATTIKMPFTVGDWQASQPVTVQLRQGVNTLRFWRDRPPQYGMAVKHFTLTPQN